MPRTRERDICFSAMFRQFTGYDVGMAVYARLRCDESTEETTEMKRIRTYMSPVFFRAFNEELPQPLLTGGQQRCLMDDLLGGGIAVPDAIVENLAASDPSHA